MSRAFRLRVRPQVQVSLNLIPVIMAACTLAAMSDACAYNPVDTAPLRRMLSLLIAFGAQIAARALQGGSLRGAERCSRLILRVTREIRACEIANIHGRALERLGTDPAWKAQMRLELGGYWVIKRWEERKKRRAMRAAQGLHAPISPHVRAATARRAGPSGPRKKVRTDNAGVFRLAPISRAPASRASVFRTLASGTPNHSALEPGAAARNTHDCRASGPQMTPYPLRPHQIAVSVIKPTKQGRADETLRRGAREPLHMPSAAAVSSDTGALPRVRSP